MAIRFESENAPYSVDRSLPWTPFAPHSELVSVKLYAADLARGKVITLLRAPPGVELPAHRSTGQTTIYTLQGRWKYREHDWVAGPGSVVIEPAGVPHTPQMLPDGTDVVILFVVADGDLLLLDAGGQVVSTENSRTAIDRYLDYCRANEIQPRDLTTLTRADDARPT
jgi:quercetin dioxygenase-like cupin family protein